MLDTCIQNFFRVSTLLRVGEGELQDIFEKDAPFKRELRNGRKIWILQYCPKDFCPGLYLVNKGKLTHDRLGPVQTNATLLANNSHIMGCYMLRLFARPVACYCMFLRCRSQHCWELLHPFAHQCQSERNNSQHCWLNIFWSCCVCLHVA